MNLRRTPRITLNGSVVPLYNFNLARYPAALRSLAHADCENGHLLVEQFSSANEKEKDSLFQAIDFLHNFLGATYFGRKHAAEALNMSDRDRKDADASRKRLCKDQNVFAESLRFEPDSSQNEEEEYGPQYANSSASIADAMKRHDSIVKKNRQIAVAKNRKLIQSTNKVGTIHERQSNDDRSKSRSS